jgi:hypothetical protein
MSADYICHRHNKSQVENYLLVSMMKKDRLPASFSLKLGGIVLVNGQCVQYTKTSSQ